MSVRPPRGVVLHLLRASLLPALAVLALTVTALAPSTALAAKPLTPKQATSLGQQAYLYGFPLLETLRVRATSTSVRCPTPAGAAPVNTFSTATRFYGPADRTVVAPNVDTLYSIAQLDLGRGPVVLSHPDMGSRYFVFQLLDPYTNVITYVGSRLTGSKAGRFAITWAKRPGHRIRGAKVIHSPYRRVWVIGRTLATDAADQRAAVKLMRRYTLSPPGGPRRFPADCRPGAAKIARTPAGLAFLSALGHALEQNPPPARDRPLLRKLARAGIGPGRTPADAHLSAATLRALEAGVNATAIALPQVVAGTLVTQAAAHGGWSNPAANIGDYGTDYRYRAGVAVAGLGANTREEATYPTALLDATGRPLDGASTSYRIVFPPGQAPPAEAFWSMTVYGSDGFLAANPVGRYAIGDSHPPLVRRADGSIVVVLSRSAPEEPEVNWLPVPAGPFRLNLRIYRPAPAALDGTWPLPQILPVP